MLAQGCLSLEIPTSVQERALWAFDPDMSGSPLPPAALASSLIAQQGLLGGGFASALTGTQLRPLSVYHPQQGPEPSGPQKAREEGEVEWLVSPRGKAWVILSRLKCGLEALKVSPFPYFP